MAWHEERRPATAGDFWLGGGRRLFRSWALGTEATVSRLWLFAHDPRREVTAGRVRKSAKAMELTGLRTTSARVGTGWHCFTTGGVRTNTGACRARWPRVLRLQDSVTFLTLKCPVHAASHHRGKSSGAKVLFSLSL